MKIICVSGGSYKSIYLNYLIKLNHCDLLIFNYGIIYDLDILDDAQSNIMIDELIYLSNRLDAIVVAGIKTKNDGCERQAIIVCSHNHYKVYNCDFGALLEIGDCKFVVGTPKTDYRKYNKIILSSKKILPNLSHCNKSKIYIFCDDFGSSLVKNAEIFRNFHKYSKIILK